MKKATRGLPFLRVLLPSTASSQLAQFLDGSQLSHRLRLIKRGSFVYRRFFGGTSSLLEVRFETVLSPRRNHSLN
jgi:hypothetical protein